MGLDNPLHIAFLLIVLLLVFGAKRLPEVGRSLGSGLRGFKDALSGDKSDSSGVEISHSERICAKACSAAARQRTSLLR